MGKKELIGIISSSILILVIGVSIGYSLGYFQAVRASFPEMKEVVDQNPNVATIKFLELKNGLLNGEIAGQKARLAYSAKNIEDLEPGAKFSIPVNGITLGQYYSTDSLPTGTQFIASRQGKYYYSILDSRSFSITPKNRIYFSESAEAERRGYLPPRN
jgi:hypothetical protein